MNKDLLLRRGTPEDGEDFSHLILLSDPTFFLMIFGAEAKSLLKSLFHYRHNLFSFEHSHFIESRGRNAGMALSFDSRAEKQERLRTGILLFQHMKVRLLLQLPRLLKADSLLGKLGKSTCYISNIAIYPEYRGQGLGTRLLMKAEEQARGLGDDRIVLDVEVDNQDAIRLYQRIGYSVIGESRSIAGGGKIHTLSRMSKKILRAPGEDC